MLRTDRVFSKLLSEILFRFPGAAGSPVSSWYRSDFVVRFGSRSAMAH